MELEVEAMLANKTRKPSAVLSHKKPTSREVRHKKIRGTTYEVVSIYLGKFTMMEVVKGAIRRDVEGGNY